MKDIIQMLDSNGGLFAGADLMRADVHERLVVVEHGRMMSQDGAQESGSRSPRSDDQQPLRMRCVPERIITGHQLPAGMDTLVQNIQRFPVLKIWKMNH